MSAFTNSGHSTVQTAYLLWAKHSYVWKSILRKTMPGGVPSNSLAKNLRAAHSPVAQPHELCLTLVRPAGAQSSSRVNGATCEARYWRLFDHRLIFNMRPRRMA
jgi:hypothetical protein